MYRAGHIHDALESAQAACERAPHNAEAWALLGRIAWHAGLPQSGDDALRRAHGLSRRHPLPGRVSAERFAQLVDEAQGALSADAQRRLAATEITWRSLPSPDEIERGVDPDAVSLRVRAPADRLVLFQVNLENRCPDEHTLLGLITRTLSRA